MGFMLPVSYGTFNHYFIKRRLFMMGVAQALKGIIVMLHPIVVNLLLTNFGQRGGMLLVSSLDAHAIFGMILMHPVEWHYKLIKVPTNSLHAAVPCTHIFQPKTREAYNHSICLLSVMNDEDEKSAEESKVEITDAEKQRPKCSRFWFEVAELLDLELLKERVYVNIVLGITFAMFADHMSTTLMPIYLVERGITMV